MTDNSQHPKVLTDYLRRVGAEVLNFRRAMIKEFKGAYYVERTLIKINSDGTVTCSDKEHAPTKEEAEAIQKAILETEFPKSIGASEAQLKNLIEASVKAGLKAEDFFPLWCRKTNKVLMVQERFQPADGGGKKFRPHSMWSDGIWRGLECEGDLPFYKPKVSRGKSKLMVHEGAKAARFVDWLLNDRSPEAKKARDDHPWTSELESYEHWGIIGGAMAPHRSDYSEIKHEQPLEVIYVCDNDWAGRTVLAKFAQRFGGSLKGIMFHQAWPESWDMADPIPKAMFSKSGKFNGPNLKSLMIPATYATKTLPNPSGKGRPITVLLDNFAQEWMHSITPEAFIHKDWPSDILSEEEFNSRVRPFSDVENTARLLVASAGSKSRRLHYKPGEKPGFSGNGDGAYINTFCPSSIKPIKGDPQPWLDYLNMLVTEDDDRHNLKRWVATFIARPDIKMDYGVLLISETQGVGKTTLGEKILAPIAGFQNVSFPSESDIVESQFNSWIAHKRLAIVNEIYAGASTKAYNKLKSIITDQQITVNKKHQATYEIESWVHILAASNSPRALKLSLDDRRWLVPKITEEKQKAGYWGEFNSWLTQEGGLGIIMHWAKLFLMDEQPVMKGDNAPSSGAKRAMIEDNMSPGQMLVANLLKEIAELTDIGDGIFTTDQRLIEVIKNQLYGGHDNPKLERPGTIRKLAKDYGWFVGEERTRHWCPAGTNGYIISRDPQLAKRDPKELKWEFEKRATGNRPEERDFDLSTNNLDAIRSRRNQAQSNM